MDMNVRQKPMTLREEYGRNRESNAWEMWPEHPPIIRFWTKPGKCIGFPFAKVTSIAYDAEANKLVINVEHVGTFMVEGPKTLAFFESFCEHTASNIKADGRDILSVVLYDPKPD